MANRKQPTPQTYMTADEFRRLGERCFGYGWITKFAEFVDYTRVQIGRYSTGVTVIPAPIALTMQLIAYCLDHGIPLSPMQPVGTIDVTGMFRPIKKADPNAPLIPLPSRAAIADIPEDAPEWTPADVLPASRAAGQSA